MTWSLVIFGSLTVLISVVSIWWIWAESKPGTLFKGRSEASNGYIQNEGMEEE